MGTVMKAIVRESYGAPDVLKLAEIPRPIPVSGEVLVQVRASSLNRGDRYFMQGEPMIARIATGLRRPKKRGLGMDFAGDVVAVDDGVTEVSVGDAVFGQVDFGEFWAEYACAPASLTAPMPSNLSYEAAATVPVSGLTALQGLRDHGAVQPGQEVLINGATGAVGTFAVQVATALGAKVTAVCGARNIDMVRSLGAAEVIPYETDDFTTCGRKFDLLFDVVGNRSLGALRQVLHPKGTLVVVGGPDGRWLGPASTILSRMLLSPFVSQRVVTFAGTPNRADMLTLAAMLDEGAIKAVIDRQFELEEAADAMRYLIDGRPSSKVGITVSQ